MPLDGPATIDHIDSSMSSIMLLNASCQAVVEAEIQEVASSWYTTLDQELGAAENLVLGWRRTGVLYFRSDILDTITAAGQFFLASSERIDALFAALKTNFTPQVQTRLAAALQSLKPPVQTTVVQIAAYLAKLQAFQAAMSNVQQEMTATIAEVQAAEAELQGQILTINQQIAQLNVQIQTDRSAIFKARSARTSGIVETIFGVILAPFTGGASLVLAGIGVASIAEAEGLIDSMESTISSYQQTIAGDQSTLTTDQRVVVTLNGLAMSTGIVLNDIATIGSALDELRTGWTAFGGELDGVVQKVTDATSTPDLVVSQAWYDAACAEWTLVVSHIAELTSAPFTSNRVTVGQPAAPIVHAPPHCHEGIG